MVENEAQTQAAAAMDEEAISVELPAPATWKKLVSLSFSKSLNFLLNLGLFLQELNSFSFKIDVLVSGSCDFLLNILFSWSSLCFFWLWNSVLVLGLVWKTVRV